MEVKNAHAEKTIAIINRMVTQDKLTTVYAKDEMLPTFEEAREYVRKLLAFAGEDPGREGLLETPDRVLKAWRELYSGYDEDPARILEKSFSETDGYDQLVVLRDIPFFSMCEHHTLLFSGFAHIGYLPRTKVVGISKLARLVDCFARRMQIQERMTKSISQSIMEHLDPLGCGVLISGVHTCMTARGVKKPGTSMVTSAMEGIFKNNISSIKDEFFFMVKL